MIALALLLAATVFADPHPRVMQPMCNVSRLAPADSFYAWVGDSLYIATVRADTTLHLVRYAWPPQHAAWEIWRPVAPPVFSDDGQLARIAARRAQIGTTVPVNAIDLTVPPLTLTGTTSLYVATRCGQDSAAHSWARVIVLRVPRKSPWIPMLPGWPLQIPYPTDSTAYLAPGTAFAIPEPVLPQGDCYAVVLHSLAGYGCMSNPVAAWTTP